MMTIRKLREQLRMGRSIYDLSLRVTYYARVSTEKVEQQGSLENQVQYYTEFIQKNPNWTFVQGYVDEGISGTSTYKRESFLRMIDDAHRGLFDFIITKEISRFSRSTLDSIQYTQELLDANVGVQPGSSTGLSVKKIVALLLVVSLGGTVIAAGAAFLVVKLRAKTKKRARH